MGQVLDALRDLIYPVRCPFCDEVLGTLRDCPACKASAEKLFHRPFRLSETEHHWNWWRAQPACMNMTGVYSRPFSA